MRRRGKSAAFAPGFHLRLNFGVTSRHAREDDVRTEKSEPFANPFFHARYFVALEVAPEMGTIAPKMGSPDADQSVGSALFGKTQRALLGLFFARPEQSFYLRQ